MTAIDTLESLGFVRNEGQAKAFQQISDDLGLSVNDNPHKVLAVFTKDDVTALIEKNISDDESGGVVSTTKHPAVLIMESPRGRVCISNQDDNAALIAQVAEDLA